MYIVVKKSNWKESFMKLIDLCKYGNLVISNRKKQTEVCIPANISTLFQRCLLVDMTSRRETPSNQR